MNHTEQIGRLTADPDLRFTSNGRAVAKFTLAVPRRFNKDETDFHPIVAFGKQAEFAEKYLKKGTKIALVGEVQNNNFKDKNGVQHYGYAIVASDIEFAESKSNNSAPKEDKDGFVNVPDDADLPFN